MMEPPVFTQSTVKQNTTKKRPLKEYYDLDGLNCSICMEPWTSDGHHQVSCLPCGHIYGLSCIEKWIQVKGTHYAKCPQCKSYVGPRDVRKLYASPVIMVHENRLKKDEMSKSAYLETKKDEMSKAAYLETERSNLLLIQDSLLKELRLLKKRVCTGTSHHEGTRKNSVDSMTGGLVHETQNGVKYGGKVDTCGSSHCNFVLEHEMAVGSACLFDMDASYKVLLLARRVPGLGVRHALEKINMEKATENGQIMLPTSTKDVKDLHISPCGRLALLASLGKKLSIISMGGNSVVMTYNLPKPAWCLGHARGITTIQIICTLDCRMVCFWYMTCAIQFIRSNPCKDWIHGRYIQYILLNIILLILRMLDNFLPLLLLVLVCGTSMIVPLLTICGYLPLFFK